MLKALGPNWDTLREMELKMKIPVPHGVNAAF